MRFQLLGHVQAIVGGGPVSLGARKQRFVLALLALEANRIVPISRLIDLVWPDGPPVSARAMVHTYISGLRSILNRYDAGADGVSLLGEAAGYELRCEPDRVDAHRFRDLLARVRAAADEEERVALSTEALDLWHGPALTGITTETTRARLSRHLDEARLACVEDRAEALLALGRHQELIDALITMSGLNPHRQRMTGQLMLALHRTGLTADALRVYDRTRRELADELGIDPSDELRRLHQAILRDDPELASSPVAVTSAAVPSHLPRPRQLPADLNTFTGRAAELDRLVGGWSPSAMTFMLSVIEGMAGSGKTTLAVHAAHRLAEHFPDGQLFLDLHGFTPGTDAVTPGDALERMLRALGVAGKKIPDGLDERAALWRSTLAGRRILLVLDNAANESQIAPLLPGTGEVLVLVTSRRRLTGLTQAAPVSLDVLPTREAVALFGTVSGVDRPHEIISEIVELCGRLPLALGIAAARLRARPSWPAAHLADRLRDQQRRLSELDAGQRSVTAAIEMSYRQLTADHQRLFRLLGVHCGSDVDAYAAAALIGLDPGRVDRLLEDLVDAHLIAEPTPARYQPHDLVRAYAAQLAEETETAAELRAAVVRLLDHYRYGAWLACEVLYPPEWKRRPHVAAPAWPTPPLSDPVRAGAWLDAEGANLLAAAAHAARHDLPTHTIELSLVLHRHYEVRSRYSDAETMHGLAIDAAIESGDRAAEARCLIDLALIAHLRARYDEALALLTRCERLHAEIGEPTVGPTPRSTRGLIGLRLGRYDEALEHLTYALAYYRRTGDPGGESGTLLNLGIVHGHTGRWAEAEEHFDEALRHSQATGNRRAEAHARTNLSIVMTETRRYAQALEHLQLALVQHRDNNDRTGEINTLGNLGLVYDQLGEREKALHQHELALTLYRRSGERAGEIESLNDIGTTLRALDRVDEAAARHREALALATMTGDRYEQGRAHDGLGHVHHLLGAVDDAREQWECALDIFTELGTPEAAQVRDQLAPLTQ